MSVDPQTLSTEPFVGMEGVRLSRTVLLELAGSFATNFVAGLESEAKRAKKDLSADPTSTLGLLTFELLGRITTDEMLPEEVRLETEELTADLARAAMEKIEQSGRKKDPSARRAIEGLAAFIRQPIREERERKQTIEREEEIARQLQEVEQEIAQLERPFSTTSSALKSLRYVLPGIEGTFDGRKLRKELEDITHLGTEHVIFHEKEAATLALISLKNEQKTPESREIFLDTMSTLSLLHERARRLGARPESRHGVASAFGKIKELLEYPVEELNRMKNKYPHFGVVLNWANTLFYGEQTPEEFVDHEDLTMPKQHDPVSAELDTARQEELRPIIDEGPFKDCPEFPIVAFSGEVTDQESIKELPPELVTDENILEDITNAVKRSRGGFVIEEDRVKQFTRVLEILKKQHGKQAIKIYRTIKPRWHPLPWYVIEINNPSQPLIVLLETPIADNASYAIYGNDWMRTGRMLRMEARKTKNAKPIIHEYRADQSLIGHTEKLIDATNTKPGAKA